MIQEATELILQGKFLTPDLMQQAMEEIMTGKLDTKQIVSFLSALSQRGESAEELTAAAFVMRRHLTKINTKHKLILDTCGTGGDALGTFNISTIAAFVASGAGIAVAKHGNRSVSSRCGSADILEALGIDVNMNKEKIEHCLDEIGIAFLFAQSLHPAMKFAVAARKEIGKKTIFNLLGPLCNPAGATHQLIGVFDKRWIRILAQALSNLGTTHALIVSSEDGLDELTTTAKSKVCEVREGQIKDYEIIPDDFGLKRVKLGDLSGGGASDNAKIMLDILNGKTGPKRDIVILNAAAAIYAADKTGSIKEAMGLAQESIDSKNALKKLELLKKYSLN